jgi:membrane-bound lytic murein transglycosylase B
MKTVTLELPDEMAAAFERLSSNNKKRVALFSIVAAQNTSSSFEDLLKKIDKQVAESGMTEKEIEDLLNELS